MRRQGVSLATVRRAIVMLDSHGLIHEGRRPLDDYKREFALSAEDMQTFGLAPGGRLDLEMVVRKVKPTVLIGTCGVACRFTEGLIRQMARDVERPVVMPCPTRPHAPRPRLPTSSRGPTVGHWSRPEAHSSLYGSPAART